MKITVGKIMRELAILINEKKKTCTTEKEVNSAVEEARREINTKYGKGWRETYPDANGNRRANYDFSKPYCAQGLGDEWGDYPWSADDF
jgi:hypothetical protein